MVGGPANELDMDTLIMPNHIELSFWNILVHLCHILGIVSVCEEYITSHSRIVHVHLLCRNVTNWSNFNECNMFVIKRCVRENTHTPQFSNRLFSR